MITNYILAALSLIFAGVSLWASGEVWLRHQRWARFSNSTFRRWFYNARLTDIDRFDAVEDLLKQAFEAGVYSVNSVK